MSLLNSRISEKKGVLHNTCCTVTILRTSLDADYVHSFPGKESSCNAGDLGSIPGLGRPPEEGNGYPLWYSGLENSTDCIVHGVPKSRTQLSNFNCVHRHESAHLNFNSNETMGLFDIQKKFPFNNNNFHTIYLPFYMLFHMTLRV